MGRYITGMGRMAAILADAGAPGPVSARRHEKMPGAGCGVSHRSGAAICRRAAIDERHSGARTIPLESLQDGGTAALVQCFICLEG